MSDRTALVLSLIPMYPLKITKRKIRSLTGLSRSTIEAELRQIGNMPGIMLCQDDEDEYGLSLIKEAEDVG